MSTYAAALSSHPQATEALAEVVGELLDRFAGTPPDLVVWFASPHHVGEFDQLAAGIAGLLDPGVALGASAISIAGGAREIEQAPALSVLGARFDAGSVRPVPLSARRGAAGYEIDGWPGDAPGGGSLILLADPFSFPVDDLLAAAHAQAPELTIVGGLASAAAGPGGNRLALGPRVSSAGAVGAWCSPEIGIDTVVSQGCRPIGRPLTVTRADGNRVEELAGRPALQRLRELAAELRPEERELVGRGLHVGIVVDEHLEDFGRGDFLVRNVLGADPEAGALVIGDAVGVGQTLQFHVRDAASADEDLRTLLAPVRAEAALLFTCNGRGTNLFDRPDHDAGVVDELVGPLPLAGAFCAGELGPVGGRNFLHGFTASLAVFRP